MKVACRQPIDGGISCGALLLASMLELHGSIVFVRATLSLPYNPRMFLRTIPVGRSLIGLIGITGRTSETDTVLDAFVIPKAQLWALHPDPSWKESSNWPTRCFPQVWGGG